MGKHKNIQFYIAQKCSQSLARKCGISFRRHPWPYLFIYFKILFLNNFLKFRLPNLISNFRNSNIHVHLFNHYFHYYYYYYFIYLLIYFFINSILKQFFKIPTSEFNYIHLFNYYFSLLLLLLYLFIYFKVPF